MIRASLRKSIVQIELLKRGLYPKGWLSGYEILKDYLSQPEAFWKAQDIHHAKKVRDARNYFHQHGVKSSGKLAAVLLDCVRNIKDKYNRPFFVMGTGGSGSSWLGAMLGDLPGFKYGREIYLPRPIEIAYRLARTQTIAEAIWSCMLLPAWAFNCPDQEFAGDFVNKARSIGCYDMYREIWPNGRFIYLTRDPRDQILTVTYRKPAYRRRVAPNACDEEYLIHNAKKYASLYSRYKRVKSDEIYFLKYEHLRGNTHNEMGKMAKVFDLNCSREEISEVVYNHDANNMRTGTVPWRGNLGKERPKSWREIMTEHEKELCHPIIQGVLEELGYESNKHW